MRKEWTLFLTFLKIGAFTFGGGYGMISLVRETVFFGSIINVGVRKIEPTKKI